jgi:hypothetical protein
MGEQLDELKGLIEEHKSAMCSKPEAVLYATQKVDKWYEAYYVPPKAGLYWKG